MSASLFTNQLCCQLNWTGGQRKGSEADLKLDIKNKFGLKELQCRRVLESELIFVYAGILACISEKMLFVLSEIIL